MSIDELIAALEDSDRFLNLKILSTFNKNIEYDKIDDDMFPNYTTSVDRALKLMREHLPGWFISHIGSDEKHRKWVCELRSTNFFSSSPKAVIAHSPIYDKNPAKAICIAILKAYKETK